MKLIAGLGNPGEQYKGTRHNLGCEAVEKYVSGVMYQALWEDNARMQAQIVKAGQLIFAKPQTYMNKSGLAVAKLVSFYKIKPEDIIVVHDELDLPLGHLKIRLGGAAAGHHGVESVIESLGTDKFIRVRLGIGNLRSQSSERGGQSFNVEHFVLEPFLPNERSTVKRLVKKGVEAIEAILKEGLEKAQNQFN